MSKVIVHLRGGLGNQLFQYATGRSLALDNCADLILDTWSGFIRDHQYRRRYELNKFQIQAQEAKRLERIPFWLFLFKNKIKKKDLFFKEKFFNTLFLVENESQYLSQINDVKIDHNTWLYGSWQSPFYFTHHKKLLQKELMPPPPLSKKLLKLGEQMRLVESVCVGVRLYEEAPNPSSSSRSGNLKTAFELQIAINKLQEKFSNAQFFLFCTHHSEFFEQLKLPKNTSWITPQNGFKDTIETLWLLTQCKHHIITNSSYFWWGAWLSETHYNSSKQMILAADNFLNKHAIPETWNTF